jgi:anti-sigma-K factor RskA/putative zinc finger protein
MSSCPTHGPLVGGYVLGALEPDEMEEMRAHVASCPHCGPEAGRLAALPGLLDRIVPADVPPPSLSPQVEEAVLDRFARERREAAEGAARRRRAGRFGRLAGPARRPLVAFGAAVLVALAIALAVLLPLGGDDGESAYASARLAGPADAAASASVAEVPAGTRIRLRTRGLPTGAEYELWCVRADGRWVSGGTFWADADGSTEAELTAAVKPGDYHWMAVTRQDRDGGDRGPVVLRGELRY